MGKAGALGQRAGWNAAFLVASHVPLSGSPGCELRAVPWVLSARPGTEVASEQTHGMKLGLRGDPFPDESDVHGRVPSVCPILLLSVLFLTSVPFFLSSSWHTCSYSLPAGRPLKNGIFPKARRLQAEDTPLSLRLLRPRGPGCGGISLTSATNQLCGLGQVSWLL